MPLPISKTQTALIAIVIANVIFGLFVVCAGFWFCVKQFADFSGLFRFCLAPTHR
jgi:hypothetical protein